MGKKMNILYFFLNYFLLPEMNVLLFKRNRGFILFLFLLNKLRQTVKWFLGHRPQFLGYNLEIQFHIHGDFICARYQAYINEQNPLIDFSFLGKTVAKTGRDIQITQEKTGENCFSISRWKFVIIVTDHLSTNDVIESFNDLYNMYMYINVKTEHQIG